MPPKLIPPSIEKLTRIILIAKNLDQAATKLGVSKSTVKIWKKKFKISHEIGANKICKKCGNKLPATTKFFQPNGLLTDGNQRLYSQCRNCSNSSSRESRLALRQNPEYLNKVRKYDSIKKKEYRANNTAYAKRQRQLKVEWHRYKTATDPDWVATENKRKSKYLKDRWHNDHVFKQNELMRAKLYRLSNPEKMKLYNKKHGKIKLEKLRNDTELREKHNELSRKRHSKNMSNPNFRAKHRLKSLKYEKRLSVATPSWLSEEDWHDIQSVYETAQMLNEYDKNKEQKSYEVDHYFPILAQDEDGNHIGCGLHVPWNLRVIEKFKNRSRGSRVFYNGAIIK